MPSGSPGCNSWKCLLCLLNVRHVLNTGKGGASPHPPPSHCRVPALTVSPRLSSLTVDALESSTEQAELTPLGPAPRWVFKSHPAFQRTTAQRLHTQPGILHASPTPPAAARIHPCIHFRQLQSCATYSLSSTRKGFYNKFPSKFL